MSVRLNLEGDDGQISAETLHAALGDVLELLREAAEVAEVEKQDWRITALEAASAHIAVAAPDENSVVELVRSGLVALEEVAAIPDRWTRQMVKRVLNLGRRAGSGGTTEVSLGLGSDRLKPLVLTTVVVANAERALGSAASTHGSLRGKIDRWNEHGKREIGLSRNSGPPVPITYSAKLSPRILSEAVGSDVEVWGTIRRNVMGQVTGMTLEDFTVLERPEATSISSLAGIYRLTDPFTLEDWLEDRHAGQ